MYPFDCWSIKLTTISMLFLLFRIYILFAIIWLAGKYCFYLSNHRCLFDCRINVFDNLSFDRTNLSNFLLLFYISDILIVNKLKGKTCFWRQFLEFIFVIRFSSKYFLEFYFQYYYHWLLTCLFVLIIS